MKGVKIQGQIYQDETSFDLFLGKTKNSNNEIIDSVKKYSVIYGRNGSGKTTISNAIEAYKNNDNSVFTSSFYDDNNNIIDVDKENIFVFNELFTNRNVTLAEGDLNAIILFGKAGAIDKAIGEIKNNIESLVKKKDLIDFEKYQRKGDIYNIEESYSKIVESLKNGWATREQKIKGNQKKSPVSSSLADEILNKTKPSKTKSVLEQLFEDGLRSLEKIRSKNDIIPTITIEWKIKSIEYYNSLLAKTYDKKEMTSFAKEVLSTIQSTSSRYLEDSKTVLLKKGMCPVCFQNIDEEHARKATAVIEMLFDGKVEKEKEILQSEIIEPVMLPDLSVYNGIVDVDLIEKLKSVFAKYNESIKIINLYLSEKEGSIYLPHKEIVEDDKSLMEEFKDVLFQFNLEIKNFNDSVEKKKTIEKELCDINKDIAYFECLSLINGYKSLLAQRQNDEKNIRNIDNKVQKYKIDINELNAKKNDTGIGLNEINNCLSLIFGTKSRLKLEPSDDGARYYVLSKGRRIKAKKLSTGERNIISLVYFYESLKTRCNEGDYFKSKSLYIIDDPISSFDYENKMGLLSFLKKMISEISSGNKESKISIFTHEIEIASFISRIFDDLQLGGQFCCAELKNNGAVYMNQTKFSNYGNILNEVFYFAEGDRTNEINIGNLIRRLVEAYCSFNYREPIDKFLAKDDYLKKINDDKLQTYFFYRMNRLVMNEDSHSEGVIRQAPDTWNFDLFDYDEKIKVARDIVVFLYCLDSKHIMRYIDSSKIRIIEGWKKDIKDNC